MHKHFTNLKYLSTIFFFLSNNLVVELILGVYMSWANSIDPVKPTQFNPKKWFDPGY
jgi:hypothetical protein